MAWFDGDYPTIASLSDSDIALFAQGGSTGIAALSKLKTYMGITSGSLLDSDSTLAGTPGNTTETTLRTYNLPAATLSSNGWFVRAIYWGRTAANANNKTVRFKFGATTFSSGASAISGPAWILETLIRRNAPGNQDMFSRILTKDGGTTWGSNMLGYMAFQEPAENLNGAVAMSLTGENGFAQASDILYEGSIILLNS